MISGSNSLSVLGLSLVRFHGEISLHQGLDLTSAHPTFHAPYTSILGLNMVIICNFWVCK